MKTVIEMAREAQIVPYIVGPANSEYIGRLERFAALVRAEALAEQPAQQEPVATLWQHGETGRTRITMPGDITDCDARWFKAADLYTSPPAQRKPLTRDQVKKLITATGYDTASPQERTDFINGIRHAEAAHGIKENT